jgi:uncharacterized membrane protein
MRPRSTLAIVLLLVLGGLAACSSGDETLAVVEPASVPEFPTFDQVYAVLERSCVPCHSRNKPRPGGLGLLQEDEEEDEDDDPNYDTCEDVIAGLGDLLEQVFAETMPPGAWPRLTEREKLLIVRWAQTGAPCE